MTDTVAFCSISSDGEPWSIRSMRTDSLKNQLCQQKPAGLLPNRRGVMSPWYWLIARA
jgi:hypothetical protein